MTTARTDNAEVAQPRAPTALDWIKFLEERRSRLTDPSDIEKVDVFIEHLAAEYAQDIPRTMATLHPDGTSRHWGGGQFVENLGPEMPNSVRNQFYGQLLELGGPNAFRFIAMETERFWVGEDGLAMDGILWNTVSGRELELWGGGPLPEGCTEDDTFEVGRRLAMFMSFRDGRIVGEDGYVDQGVIVRRVASMPELPAQP